MRGEWRLRSLAAAWVLLAFGAGALAAWLWIGSTAAWREHQLRAQAGGVALYEALRGQARPPAGVTLQFLSPAEAVLAGQGAFARLQTPGKPAHITNLSIHSSLGDVTSGSVLNLAVISSSLRYQVSELPGGADRSAPQKLGAVTQLLATYCSDPILLAQLDGGLWRRVDGTALWGCDAAPTDRRLWAVFLATVALGILLGQAAEIAARFDRFGQALRAHRRFGGPESYDVEGPTELRDIVEAVNDYLESERAQLSKRAVVLSGVSHDLGTPATRLRLRAALISDAELRQKLEGDIDQMTGMIESVLTYTRSELSTEEPRQISLTALIEALVEDYQDCGDSVSFSRRGPEMIEGGRSLFTGRPGHAVAPEERRVLVTARPVSLQRALSNLIDNALKYGRRATVELEAMADRAIITVEDEGSGFAPEDLEGMLAPFQRGPNAQSVDGFGLGLTIVATVAEQHGGRLVFEQGRAGLRARLEVQRQ
ncbi:sensor histidine kinase [Thalassovita mediterranea]|jgi:signal transduction histidine kinase|uniref:histidine kinase n=1 Tax=Thalassovita mediterranea TaxID=340021 RepID=A0A0P1H1Z8_9RHOB|nr:ATP-binding protein [Thalassovita mediterranea]CUH84073.1 Osmolarity sensor protein EnvZ [Thalassovita mediterranea]SIS27779.1 Signal transduction histidine kinase [Thalassovita mediterranea]